MSSISSCAQQIKDVARHLALPMGVLSGDLTKWGRIV